MRPPVLLVIVSTLLGAALCFPADGDKGTDNRVGLERPSTEAPPQTSECGLDSLLGEVFGTNGNSGCKTGGTGGGSPNPQPDPQTYPQPDPQPDPQTYPQPDPQTYPQPDPQPYPQPGSGSEDGCVCVQYYLCNDNNTINEDGVGLIDIRIKDEECTDYLQKCCGSNNVLPPTQPVPTSRPIGTVNSCGVRNFEGIGFRITGNNDNEAQYGEFPWMVAVIRPDPTLSQQGKSVNVYQCGGSLIHPQVVLTGAHCVRGKDNLVIRAGEWDTQTKNELYPTQDRRVSEVIVHEKFNNGSLANDPALLILEEPVDMTVENVGLICLPQQNEIMDGRDCVASGWGKDLFGKEGKYSVILKRVDLPIVNRNSCQQALRNTRLGQRFKLHESFLCAGGQPGKDTCKGDGGGPLVCPTRDNNRIYVQAGIVAWGIDCNTETPGVYVNVASFANWIRDKLDSRNIALQ